MENHFATTAWKATICSSFSEKNSSALHFWHRILTRNDRILLGMFVPASDAFDFIRMVKKRRIRTEEQKICWIPFDQSIDFTQKEKKRKCMIRSVMKEDCKLYYRVPSSQDFFYVHIPVNSQDALFFMFDAYYSLLLLKAMLLRDCFILILYNRLFICGTELPITFFHSFMRLILI